MAVGMARIAGIKAGEKILVEEQDKTGYTVDPKAAGPGTFKVAEQDKTGYTVDIKAVSHGTLNVAEQDKSGYSGNILHPAQFLAVQRNQYTTGNSWSSVICLDQYYYRFVLIAETNGVLWRPHTGGSVDNYFEIPSNVMIEIDYVTTCYYHKSRETDKPATLIVMALR